ncbi:MULTISPECIES: amino acid ABC transporter ATP-binding protein [unclassified Rhizobium]|uniref:amino acid ABC transporter ATP-binding protein n=1 Tax=unclassified Rhizobium TaxID=2613769 RepID=UPI00160E13FF|nr:MULTISPECIES: amino acid ABC transporter ATP-binding protein [unclassified Rhizobium]MBB3318826.1 ABC-type polar amino acid transport system ATPase subunit [Rhizobium sp. BK181]MBB3543159.1 ABC-type polar amino acid transport system ATPase subunit [Rhizobium sp. BK399]MCS3742374.1 ABC-type polar amino acid transport system ATPase subunit [Rhizobium sp. BK661]MCS4094798.1 ABC-type polar amino acid transport system ATPase subunit [Rhizobium sp. BK176]
MIRVENVRKSFGQTPVLDGVDLTIAPGEVVSILGSSGSGKSTLIRCINGLERLSGGRIMVDEFDVSMPKELAEARKRSGTVFQLFNLYPHMTVLGNITLAPIEVLKKPRGEAEARARALLESVGLGGRADAYPAQLSGGQRQRVGICRALAMQPRYLLLDEVTSALDPEMTAEVLTILAKLAQDGTTMLFVTHEVEFARQISDRIVFLDKGKLLVDLPTKDFFDNSGGMAQPRVAQFLSKMRKD